MSLPNFNFSHVFDQSLVKMQNFKDVTEKSSKIKNRFIQKGKKKSRKNVELKIVHKLYNNSMQFFIAVIFLRITVCDHRQIYSILF